MTARRARPPAEKAPARWATYDHQRARPRLPGVTVSPAVIAALRARMAAGETASAVVERALRRELGLPPGSP